MKIKRSIITTMLAVLLSVGASADQQRHFRFATQASDAKHRTFGFTGQVDALNRRGGMLVVEDSVFHISESTLVHKRRGRKGTLSDIRPGTRIGFNPDANGSSPINEIWILPRNFKAQPGYASKTEE